MAKVMQRCFWILVGLAASAALIWVLLTKSVAVGTAAVSRGPLTASVRGDGKTRVRDLYEVAAPVDGTLERVAVEPGDAVTQNDTVARIAPTASRPLDPRSRAEAEAAVDAARAAVNRANAAIREATVALEHANRRLTTARDLAERGAAPKLDAVHAGHEAEIRERALEEARATARQARAELARASAVVTTADAAPGSAGIEVKPPAAGEVLRIVRESGGPIAVGMPILQIGDVSRLEVVADLLSSDAAEVERGAVATITGWGGQALRSRVRRIDPAAFTKVSALGIEEQRVNVILEFAEIPPPNLGHDYHVDVAIVVWKDENVLRVPSTALFRQGDEWAVYAVRDGRARLSTVTTGPSNEHWTAIEGGLSEGAIVVTQPSDEVRDGVRVGEER